MIQLKIFHRHGYHANPCPIPYCDEDERIEELKRVFGEALATADDAKEITSYINTHTTINSNHFMIVTVSFSTFLVVAGRHGNIMLEGLVQKLDSLKKASAFALAKTNIDEKEVLPKTLRRSVEEMKDFLMRK